MPELQLVVLKEGQLKHLPPCIWDSLAKFHQQKVLLIDF